MKKLFLLCIMSLFGMVAKAEYTSLIFNTIDGSEYSIASSNLEIKFTAEKLVATSQGNTLELPLAKLASMQFSEKQSGIEGTIITTSSEVKVYGIDGTLKGSYDSFSKATNGLEKGVYIVKDNNGLSVKIAITK